MTWHAAGALGLWGADAAACVYESGSRAECFRSGM